MKWNEKQDYEALKDKEYNNYFEKLGINLELLDLGESDLEIKIAENEPALDKFRKPISQVKNVRPEKTCSKIVKVFSHLTAKFVTPFNNSHNEDLTMLRGQFPS